jgi:hypothetical protein
MNARQLYLGYLASGTVGETIKEFEGLNYDTSIEAYTAKYRDDKYKHKIVILPVGEVNQVIKSMLPDYGKAMSYEVVFTTCSRYDPVKKTVIPEKKRQARLVYWTLFNLQRRLDACNLMATLTEHYYTAKNSVRIYAPKDCYIQVLYQSDSPVFWAKENARKYAALQRNREIKAVTKRLDRK